MDLGLHGQRAIITAASRGLGKAAALALAGEGAHVAICSRSVQIKQSAQEIEQAAGGSVFAQKADLTKAAEVKQFVAAAIQKLGGVDILIINSGGPKPGAFLDLTSEAWKEAVDLTLMSCVNLCYAVIPTMLEQGSGSIVTTQSYSVKQPIANLVLSNSVRLAVIGLMKSLANELGPKGIRVNSINPSWTQTERVHQLIQDRAKRSGRPLKEEEQMIMDSIPLGRMGSIDEFGRTIAWLASPAASFIQGHALMFDGGATASPL